MNRKQIIKKIEKKYMNIKYNIGDANISKNIDLKKFLEINNVKLTNEENYEYNGLGIDKQSAGLIYLLRKHNKNVCVVFSKEGVSLTWKSYDKILENTNSFIDNFNRCKSRTRFTIIPLTIDYNDYEEKEEFEWVYNLDTEEWELEEEEEEEKNRFHANMLLYDRVTNTVELFEPHGVCINSIYAESNKILNDALHYFFKNNKLATYVGVSCPFIGPQGSEECDIEGSSGFCGMWSIWFADLKLSYASSFPNMDSYLLLEKAMEHLDSIGYTKFIYGYSKFILHFTRMLKYKNRELLTQIKNDYLDDLIDRVIKSIDDMDVIDDIDIDAIIDNEINETNANVYDDFFNYILTEELYKLRIPKSYINRDEYHERYKNYEIN